MGESCGHLTGAIQISCRFALLDACSYDDHRENERLVADVSDESAEGSIGLT